MISLITPLQYSSERLKYFDEAIDSVLKNPEITEWIVVVDGGAENECRNIEKILKIEPHYKY